MACSSQQANSDTDSGVVAQPMPACTGQQNEAPCDLDTTDAGCAGCAEDAGYVCYCTPYSIGDASSVWACGRTGSACQQ